MLPTGAITLITSTKAQTKSAKAKKAMKSLSIGALLRGTIVPTHALRDCKTRVAMRGVLLGVYEERRAERSASSLRERPWTAVQMLAIDFDEEGSGGWGGGCCRIVAGFEKHGIIFLEKKKVYM